MNAAKLKTRIIIVLALIVAVQAVWIARSPSLPGDGRPEVGEVRVSPDRTAIEVALTSPADTASIPADETATITPALDGRWRWANPYLLRFETRAPMPEEAEYTVELLPALDLSGERTFTVGTGAFALTAITLSEQAGNAPASAVIAVVLEFTGPVSPENILTHARLVNEADGSEVPLRAMTSWTSRYMELSSDPVTKTPEGSTYVLTVSRALKKAGSALSLSRDATASIPVRLDPVLAYRGADAWSSATGSGIRLSFSTPMDARTAAPFVSIRPEAGHTLSADGAALLLSGGLAPGTRYTVTLRQGLTAADGAVLNNNETATLSVPDVTPSVDFVGTGLFLPPGRKAGLALSVVNADRVELRVDRVYPNNLFTMLGDYGSRLFEDTWDYGGVPDTLGGRIFETTLHAEGERNVPVRLPVRLDAIRAGERGLFRLSTSIPGQSGVQRWLVLTDIGLTAKRGAEDFLIWAVSNTSLAPLPGTRLTLISDRNQRLGSAVADANGSARITLPSAGEGKGDNGETAERGPGAPFMLLAERDDDFAFLLLSRAAVDTTGLDVAGAQTPASGLRAYLYGERDLYRPGETAQGMAVVRRDNLTIPAPMPLTLVQRDPRGREVRKLRLDSGPAGAVPFALDLPGYALTGTHALELLAGDTVIGSSPLKVEEFVPDRIKVAVTTPADAVAPGQEIKADVSAEYLFGPPASALPVALRVQLRPAPFTARGYEDYHFGDPDAPFAPLEIFSESADLDEAGRADFTIAIPSSLLPPAALEAIILARVSEAGGRGVTARKRVVVHPHPFYLGLRQMERKGLDPGKPATFDFVAVDADGQAATHGPLAARLYRDRWRTAVRLTPSGGYRYESVNDPELLAEQAIPAGTGAGSVTFTPPDHGSYRVRVTPADPAASGAAGVVAFFCGGWGDSPWALENPARVELVADKDHYLAGENALIQIRAPFPGRLLVAVEGRFVNDVRVVELAGNTGEVVIPIRQTFGPNVHVTALLVRKASDVDEGSVGRAFGAIPLLVDTGANRLDVTVDAPAEVRPEAELELAIRLPGDMSPGALVTIAAVDEGILQLSGAGDPDPFGFFHARRALGVTSYDTFAMLYPDLARVLGAAAAGGGMDLAAESQFMRTESIRRITPVAFWSGPLSVGGDNTVRWRVTLPDFQGALRVVAVGLDGKRFGTGRAMVRVRSPLAVTPTLPRFMAPGDEIEMPVTVRNDLDADSAAITLTVSASGALTTTAEPLTLDLKHGEEQTVYVPVSALPGPGGDGTVTVTATGSPTGTGSSSGTGSGPGTIETRRVVTHLPVRPAAPMRRELAFGALDTPSGELVPAARGFVPGTATRSVTLGGLPLARFAGRLENLMKYPYGCAEQVASQALPLIRFGDLAREFAPSLAGERGPAFMVQSAIMRLQSMQTDNGGFALWPGGNEDSGWVSAYVTLFLVEAARAGYGSPGMTGRALERMAELAASRPADPAVAALALYDLALAGRPDRGAMDELRDRKPGPLPDLARTLLGSAYALAGDMDSFNGLLATRPQAGEGRQPGGGMGSGLRDAALMLLALAEAAPSDPLVPELAADVARRMTAPDWGTTQENGLAFAALGRTLAGIDPAPLTGRLAAGDWTADFADAASVTLDTDVADAPLTADLGAHNATVYWSVVTRGVPLPESLAPVSQGLEIRRTFLDRTGAIVDMTSLPQGALVIMKTEVRSVIGGVENVAVQCLLPAGLEVENPRLETTETAPLARDDELPLSGHQDLRDDRVLFFTDLPRPGWHAGYTQLRAVTPGSFALPPVQAEAMYDPDITASDAPGRMAVTRQP
ncbi:MAG: MG2 domain-containing protein [Pseudomonadota bacterium]